MYRLYILGRPTSFRAWGTLINSTTFRPRKEDAWIYVPFSFRFLYQLTSLFPLQSFSHSVHRNSSIACLATTLSSKMNPARRNHKNEQIEKSLERRQKSPTLRILSVVSKWHLPSLQLKMFAVQFAGNCAKWGRVMILYNTETSVPKAVCGQTSTIFGAKV